MWQPAFREEEIPEVGCYYEYTIGPQSIALVRQKDGSINAFHSACAQRDEMLFAAAVARPIGTCAVSFTAGATGWTAGPPSSRVVTNSPPAHASSGAYVRSPSAWGGWVFVSMTGNPRDLLEWLDPLPTALARFRMQDMRYRWRKRTFLPANRKTVIDAFIEGYHTRGPSADHAIGGRSTAVGRARTATGVRLRSLHPNHHAQEPLAVRLHAASRIWALCRRRAWVRAGTSLVVLVL